MKKIIALFCSIFLLTLPGFPIASAESTVDLQSMSTDELTALRDAITVELRQRAEAASTDTDASSFVLSGSGTQILDGIELTAPISRFVVTCDDAIKVTYFSDGDSRSYDDFRCFVNCIEKPISISSLMIESKGNWTVDLSPINEMNGTYASGTGPYITDTFTTSPPTIVTITYEQHKYGGYIWVYLKKIMEDGSVRTETAIDQALIGDLTAYDVIIKPEENVRAYFWMIDCPLDTKWSIAEK